MFKWKSFLFFRTQNAGRVSGFGWADHLFSCQGRGCNRVCLATGQSSEIHLNMTPSSHKFKNFKRVNPTGIRQGFFTNANPKWPGVLPRPFQAGSSFPLSRQHFTNTPVFSDDPVEMGHLIHHTRIKRTSIKIERLEFYDSDLLRQCQLSSWDVWLNWYFQRFLLSTVPTHLYMVHVRKFE